MLLRPLFALALLLPLLSCRARWRWAGPAEAAAPGEVEEPESRRTRIHGHRDYPRPIEDVWRATIEALHASGIPVPQSARVAGEQGRIDIDAVRVRAVEDPVGETCVEIFFRGVSGDEGVGRAEELLRQIAGRLDDR